MAKYIIDIPEEVKWIQGIKSTGFGTQDCRIMKVKDLKPYTEPDRKAIENDVWEFMNKLLFTKYDDRRDCFGNNNSFVRILKNYSYQEAKSKYEAWKEQEEQIRVGDEVKHKQYEWKAFVTNISESGCLTLMRGLGEASGGFDPENFEKTGKHCAEVEELVKKIGEMYV